MSFDTDAQSHINAKIAVDGFMWPRVQEAINDFVVGCKADPSLFPGVSNWIAMKAACLLSGARTLAGALVPLKGTAPTNIGFIQADYNPLTGLKGDGATKSIKTNRNNNADPQNNMSIAAWVTEIPTITGNGSYIGNSRAAGARSLQVGAWRANSPPVLDDVPGVGLGLIGLSRTSPDDFWAFKWGEHSLKARTSEAPLSQNLYVFRSGTASSELINARISFYEAGEAVDLVSLSARVSQYMAGIAEVATSATPRLIAPSLSHGVIG